jgi:hypothetical protein
MLNSEIHMYEITSGESELGVAQELDQVCRSEENDFLMMYVSFCATFESRNLGASIHLSSQVLIKAKTLQCLS